MYTFAMPPMKICEKAVVRHAAAPLAAFHRKRHVRTQDRQDNSAD
jgi:hypothetical protein